jgi:hypothetical protein
MQAGPSHSGQQPTSNRAKQDHRALVRVVAALPWGANAEDEHRQGENREGNLQVLAVDLAGAEQTERICCSWFIPFPVVCTAKYMRPQASKQPPVD